MLYDELLRDLHAKTQLYDEITALVVQKQDMNELDIVPRNEFLNNWIEETIAAINKEVPDKSDPPSWDRYNAVFRGIIKNH